jgi:hypothetical protein
MKIYSRLTSSAKDVVRIAAVITLASGIWAVPCRAAPTITVQPASVSVKSETQPPLSVVASGSGSLTYQWYHFGEAIAGATGSTYVPITAPSSYTQQIDSGAYWVNVADSNGTTASQEADLLFGGNLGLVSSDINLESLSTGAGALAPWFDVATYGSALVSSGTNDPISGVLATSAIGTGKAGYIGGAGTNSTLTPSSGIFAVSMFPGFSSESVENLTSSANPVVRFDVDVSIARNAGTNSQNFYFTVYDALGSVPSNNFAYHSEVEFGPDSHIYIQDNQQSSYIDTGVTVASGDVCHVTLTVNYQAATWSAVVTDVTTGVTSPVATNRAINGSGYTVSGWTAISDGWVNIGCYAPAASSTNNGFADRMVFDNYVVTQLGASPPQATVLPQPPSTPYQFTTFAGKGTGGFADGAGSAALLSEPTNIAVDSSGNFFVSDTGNETIRKITPAGVVSTFAGTAGVAGSADGTGTAATFNGPDGIATDSSNNVYVVDSQSFTIRKITPAGVVSTLAGTAGVSGSLDGTGSNAQFLANEGIVADSNGNLFVADGGSNVIRKITPSGAVTTLAGTVGTQASKDGTGSAAQFAFPFGLGIDASNNLFVGDINSGAIRKMTPAGVVTTFAGTPGQNSSSVDGTGSSASFSTPFGVTVGADGNIYVADGNGTAIRKITPSAVVTTLAGNSGTYGYQDGTGSAAKFYQAFGLVGDSGGNLHVVDQVNSAVRTVSASGVVATFVGTGPFAGSTNGPGSLARFSTPYYVGVDGSGNVFVEDYGNNEIRKITPAGVVSNFATLVSGGDGFAVDPNADIFFGTPPTVTMMSPQGVVSTLAGNATPGYVNGTGSSAEFGYWYATSIVADSNGNVYVWDNQAIRKITPAGVVSTVYGFAQNGSFVGSGTLSMQSSYVFAMGVDSNGNIYVDSNLSIYKITPAGVSTTLYANGTYPYAGYFDAYPGITADLSGNVYIIGQQGNLWKIDTDGVLSIIAGSPGAGAGNADGVGSAVRFGQLNGIAVDGSGNVYVSDTSNNAIRKGVPAAPRISAEPLNVNLSFGQSTQFTVTAGGSGTLSYQWQVEPSGSDSFTDVSDGGPYTGSTTPTLTLVGPSSGLTGAEYQCVVTSIYGTVTTTPATLAVGNATSDLANLSVRTLVGGTNGDAFASFSIEGTQPKEILVRGDGPSLSLFGVAGALPDPAVVVTNAVDSVVASNTGWANSSLVSTTAAAVGAYAFPANSLDSALVQSLTPGTYAVDLSGASADSGTALLEVYSADSVPRITYLAGRALNGVGANEIVAGFTVAGGNSHTFLIRALGPALGSNGNANPGLQILQSSNVLTSNSGWGSTATSPSIVAAETAAGLQPLPDNSLDCALLTTLAPGAYTARASGGIGMMLIEITEIDSDRAASAAAAIVSQPTNAAVNPGSATTLGVVAVGIPQPTFQWKFNGNVINGATGSTLTLPSAQAGNAGVYTVEVSNSGGSVLSAPATLTVNSPPSISSQPQNVTINSGQNASFSVAAIGTPTLAYQWQSSSNGSWQSVSNLGEFSGATSPTLTITGDTGGLNGATYRCVVTNSQGSATSSAATLTVDTAPTFYSQPYSVYAYAGLPTTFSVSSTSSPAPSFHWQVSTDGGSTWTSLSDGNGIVGSATATLGIVDVTNSMAGFEYRALATNSLGTATSLPATLSIAAVPPQIPYVFSTLAGFAAGGYEDGTGSAALFELPGGAAVDAAGNLYVTDSANYVIRKVTPAGVVTTIAGTPGVSGFVNGPASTAQFFYPNAIAVDATGNIFVADDYTIRKITPAGTVSTLAGIPGLLALINGTGSLAGFDYPSAMVADANGNLFVVDETTIREITPAGVVTTFAGSILTGYQFTYTNGTGSAATFQYPQGLGIDGSGNLYVSDDDTVRKITPGGVVTTLAGTPGVYGSTDGTGSTAEFNGSSALTSDAAGNVYTFTGTAIRKITPAGVVTTYAGSVNNGGNADGTGSAASFGYNYTSASLAADNSGNVYYVDSVNFDIRKISPGGVVRTIAGVPPVIGSANGTGSAAQFNDLYDITVDGSGNIYVADNLSGELRKIAPGGVVTNVAPLSYAQDIAADANGDVFYFANNAVGEITSTGVNKAIAGGGAYGYTNGTGTAASFQGFIPTVAFTADPSGNVYLVDFINQAIRKITPAGVVTTFFGKAPDGSFVGTGTFAGQAWTGEFIFSLAADGNGNVYANEYSSIYKIDASGHSTTLAQEGQSNDFYPYPGIAVDPSGTLFIVGQTGSIWTLPPGGTLSIIAGPRIGGENGTGAAVGFNQANGIAVDANDNVYVADTGNNVIRVGMPHSAPSVSTPPTAETGNIGGSATFTVGGKSNLAITYAWYLNNVALTDGTQADGSVVSGSATSSLTISGLAADENGANLTVGLTNAAGSTTSSPATLTVDLPPSIATQPQSVAISSGQNATFTVEASSQTPTTYGWQIEVPDTGYWQFVQNTGEYSGATTASLTITGDTGGLNGAQVRCVVYNNQGSATSNPATLTVSSAPIINLQPSSETVVLGTPTTFSVSSLSSPAPTYQWQVSSDGGSTWSNESDGSGILGSATPTLAITSATGALNSHEYRAVVTNTLGHATSTAATLTVGSAPAQTPYTFTTLAGTAPGGYVDATGSAARFEFPDAAAVDPSGNVYVSDSGNNVIRKITPAGVVTTLAGTVGSSGYVNGAGSAAQLHPYAIAADTSGNLYVTDSNTIRKVTAAGVVTTLAGVPNLSADLDGTGSSALFYAPLSIVADASGNLFVADDETIRKVTPGGVVTTLAGTPAGSSLSSYLNGTGSSASFQGITGMTIDGSGNLYVADSNTIRKVTPSGVVSTLAGLYGGTANSPVDGTGSAAAFYSLGGMAVGNDGNIYAFDKNGLIIRKVTPAGVVTTVAGNPNSVGSANGTGSAAAFGGESTYANLAAAPNGNLYIADASNQDVRMMTPAGVVTTLAGTPPVLADTNGTGSSARFSDPQGVALDGSGDVFVTDSIGIRKITPGGAVTTVTTGVTGPSIAVDSSGNLYTMSSGVVYKVTPSGTVSLLAGNPQNGYGYANGTGSEAVFFSLGEEALAVDSGGNVYVADWLNYAVRKITPAGVVTTLAGNGPQGVGLVGTGSVSLISSNSFLSGIAVDAAGNVFVGSVDAVNGSNIAKITPDGNVTAVTFTGPTGPHFFSVWGLAVDGGDNLYFTGYPNPFGDEPIYRVSSSGALSVIGGEFGAEGWVDGTGSAVRFSGPYGIAADAAGDVFIAEISNNVVRKGVPLVAPSVASQPTAQSGNNGGSATFTIGGASAAPVSYAWYLNSVALTDGTQADGSVVSGSATGSLTISNISPDENGANLTVVLTNAAGSTTSNAATLTVHGVTPQSITLVQPADVDVTSAAFQVQSLTSSGLAAVLAVESGPATINGSTVTLTGSTGTVVLQANQPGNTTYAAAPTVLVSFNVAAAPNPPTITGFSTNGTVSAGNSKTLWVTARGSVPFTYQWTLGGTPITGATNSTYTVTNAQAANAGSYSVAVTNAGGSASPANPAVLTVNAASSTPPPVVVSDPLTVTGDSGGTIVLTVNGLQQGTGASSVTGGRKGAAVLGGSGGAGPAADVLTYQWFLDNVAISGATQSTYVITHAQAAIQAEYTCLVSNNEGSTLTSPQTVSIVSTPFPGRLVNISCRALTQAGGNQLIAGYVIGGNGTSGSLPVLIRASGPTLGSFGVSGTIPDPKLTLNRSNSDGTNTIVDLNAGWAGSSLVSTTAAQVGAFTWSNTASLDSALVENLAEGAYTAQVTGTANDSGVTLAEVYDATPSGAYTSASPRLVNISARVQVGTGGNILIAGFVISGSTSRTVLIRGTGPTLKTFGLSGTLPDPQLTLNRSNSDGSNTVLQVNTGWAGDPQIAAAASAVGAFSWATSSADSAVLATLPPGAYTAEVAGASNDTGIALVEVYEVQ